MTNQNAQVRIRDFLTNQLGLETNIGGDDLLFSGGLLESIDIIELIDFLKTAFDLEVSPLEVNLDNFDSLNRIVEYINKN